MINQFETFPVQPQAPQLYTKLNDVLEGVASSDTVRNKLAGMLSGNGYAEDEIDLSGMTARDIGLVFRRHPSNYNGLFIPIKETPNLAFADQIALSKVMQVDISDKAESEAVLGERPIAVDLSAYADKAGACDPDTFEDKRISGVPINEYQLYVPESGVSPFLIPMAYVDSLYNEGVDDPSLTEILEFMGRLPIFPPIDFVEIVVDRVAANAPKAIGEPSITLRQAWTR